ncbi:RimJ/RimL family protein N-acetyltransferase [Actinophytocola oryzae]|uniref:RimJ/RimL family protein N-acetyltransferase n=2 Tax=Actinophytocola oryzae TaxID=502181 RepID=A0A4R7VMS6_9PSEU|nr:RimJ/RimL family protein N-acetyltransferase [Actinophytocola oryzae]
MADLPVLTDGVVTLRAHRVSDVDGIVEQCVDPDSVRWTTVPTPYDRELARSYVTEEVPEGWRTGRELNFAIESEHPDGERRFSGSISLRPMGGGLAEIAFGLHPAVRGNGVCSRAVKLILDWGFQRGDIEVVLWLAHVGNWGSWRVAWANGFTFHGTIKKLLSQRGERHDCWQGTLRADDSREPKHKWNVPPVLESDRLRMRPHRETDATRYAEILNDERSRHFGGRSVWLSQLPNKEHGIHRAREANARGDRYDWTIADRETDELIGQIQLFNLEGLDDTMAGIGYSMHPSRRGQGVLTEALGMLTEWAFREKEKGGLGLRRLKLGTATTNKASRHAAESAGFLHIATEPDAFPTGETGFEAEAIYHRLNPDWVEVKETPRY